MISPVFNVVSALRRRRSAVSRLARVRAIAADIVATSFSFCHGLRMKSTAPRFRVSTASATPPNAVIMTTDRLGSRRCRRSSQSSPSWPEWAPGRKFMSSSTASRPRALTISSSSSGAVRVSTCAACDASARRAARSTPGSSSMISMCPRDVMADIVHFRVR